MFNPYSAGINFSRQNLTSVDLRFKCASMQVRKYAGVQAQIHAQVCKCAKYSQVRKDMCKYIRKCVRASAQVLAQVLVQVRM